MKKVIKHHTYLFTFLLFFILRIGLSQNPIPKIIPPSPNAASLGQFGNIPVNMSAGLPNISIPLYEANQGGLILPISLFYN